MSNNALHQVAKKGSGAGRCGERSGSVALLLGWLIAGGWLVRTRFSRVFDMRSHRELPLSSSRNSHQLQSL